MTRDERIVIRTTPNNKEKIRQKAQEEGLSTASWVRKTILKELPKEVTP